MSSKLCLLLSSFLRLSLILSVTSAVTQAPSPCGIKSLRIKKLNNVTSQIIYTLEVNNLAECHHNYSFHFKSCDTGKSWEPVPCSGKPPKNQNTLWSCTARYGGMQTIVDDQSRMTYDKCFYMPGVYVWPKYLDFSLTETHVEMTFNSDERIMGWNLTGYEYRGGGIIENCPRERGSGFVSVFSETNIGSMSEVKKNFTFNPDRCYCFEIAAIGYSNTQLVTPRLQTDYCRPEKVSTKHKKWFEMLLGPILGATTLAALVLICIAVMYKRYKKLPDPKPRDSLFIYCPEDVLVVYAKHNVRHERLAEGLIRSMQRKTNQQIYDIQNFTSVERLADNNEWLRQRLASDKVLVLLSPTLYRFLETVYEHKEEDNHDVSLQDDPSLVYALRSLSSNDYSRIYVARFCEDNGNDKESERIGKVLNRRRQYNLPENLKILMNDLLGVDG